MGGGGRRRLALAGRVRDCRWRRFSHSPRPGQGAVARTAASICGQPFPFIWAPRVGRPRSFRVILTLSPPAVACHRLGKTAPVAHIILRTHKDTKARALKLEERGENGKMRRSFTVWAPIPSLSGARRRPVVSFVDRSGTPRYAGDQNRPCVSASAIPALCLSRAPVSNVPDCQEHPGIRSWPRAAPLELWE